MRWPRRCSKAVTRVECPGLPGDFARHGDDDHTVSRTAQGVSSRRIGFAPRGRTTPSLLVQRAMDESVSPHNGGVLSTGHRGCLTQQAVPTIACGTPGASGATVVTMLVCFSLLHTGLRMRSRIRRSARPQLEGGTKESFGRPRAVITTGAMARGCPRFRAMCRANAKF